jgi:hypothetical protein
MPTVCANRPFFVDVAIGYVVIAAACALLKLSTPLWGQPVWLVGSLSWTEIAVGPLIASACACGADRLTEYFAARLERRTQAD